MSLYLAGHGKNYRKLIKSGHLGGPDQTGQVTKLLYLEKERLATGKLQESSLKTMTGTTVDPAMTKIK